jgi:hypothetical protein
MLGFCLVLALEREATLFGGRMLLCTKVAQKFWQFSLVNSSQL